MWLGSISCLLIAVQAADCNDETSIWHRVTGLDGPFQPTEVNEPTDVARTVPNTGLLLLHSTIEGKVLVLMRSQH